MTASEILRVATTVGVIQLICDLIANWRIYSREPYERALAGVSRAKFKLERTLASTAASSSSKESTTASKKSNKAEKLAKQLKRVEDDHADALANVARRHTVPNILTSLLFVILLRVLGTEMKGNIIAVLPFAPFSMMKRITFRGLQFSDLMFDPVSAKVTDVGQACSFFFIYVLSTMSIKFYINRLFGTKPPPGAESIMSIMNSPQGQKMLRAAGVDPNDLKME